MEYKRYIACYKYVATVCTYYFKTTPQKASFIVMKQNHLFPHLCWVHMTILLISARKLYKNYYQHDAGSTCNFMADYTYRFSVPHIQSSYESNFFKDSLGQYSLSSWYDSLGYGAPLCPNPHTKGGGGHLLLVLSQPLTNNQPIRKKWMLIWGCWNGWDK